MPNKLVMNHDLRVECVKLFAESSIATVQCPSMRRPALWSLNCAYNVSLDVLDCSKLRNRADRRHARGTVVDDTRSSLSHAPLVCPADLLRSWFPVAYVCFSNRRRIGRSTFFGCIHDVFRMTWAQHTMHPFLDRHCRGARLIDCTFRLPFPLWFCGRFQIQLAYFSTKVPFRILCSRHLFSSALCNIQLYEWISVNIWKIRYSSDWSKPILSSINVIIFWSEIE